MVSTFRRFFGKTGYRFLSFLLPLLPFLVKFSATNQWYQLIMRTCIRLRWEETIDIYIYIFFFLFFLRAILRRSIVIQGASFQGKVGVQFSGKMTSGIATCCQRAFSFLGRARTIVRVLSGSIGDRVRSSTALNRSISCWRRMLSTSGTLARTGTLNRRLARTSLALSYSRQITPDQWNLQDTFTLYRFRTWEPYCRHKQKDCICILGPHGHVSFQYKRSFPLISRILRAIYIYIYVQFIIHPSITANTAFLC